jgi:hypothetical protein
LVLVETVWFAIIAAAYVGLAYVTRRWTGPALLTIPVGVVVFIATAWVEL